jgi:hypothetical protein
MLLVILLVVLILALVGTVPVWPYSRGWSYYRSGGIGVLLLILLALRLQGKM